MLSRESLRDDIERAFGLGVDAGPPRLGLEVEAIPVDDAGRPSPLPRTLDLLGALGWARRVSAKSGVPELHRPNGARLTFEPGGQVEYSSTPQTTGSALLVEVESAMSEIGSALAPGGLSLLFTGLDPQTAVERVALQLDADRYRRMDEHFATIGGSGRRMMRQTASIQLCVDAGAAPLDRWRLLATLAPVAAAVFANSPLDTGVFTGERSIRRRIWAELDPTRTGLRALGRDPVGEYLDFALAAPAFLLGDDPRRAEPFENWIARGATHDDWSAHLSTLFPDIRPRGYFEFRVADAVAGDALPAIIALVAGIAWHEPAATAALRTLPVPNGELMAVAGRDALADPSLARAASVATRLAVNACDALGPALLTTADAHRARRFFDAYANAARSPADDLHAPVAA